MMRHISGNRRHAGFTFFELMVVLSVGLIVAAIGVPRMNNVIANMKLRSSMTTVSGFFQNVRMLAVKRNTTMTARYVPPSSTPPYSLVYYTKEATDSSTTPVVSDSQVELEAPINPGTTPTGPGAPPALTLSQLGLLSSPETGNPSFNSHGLPCKYASPGNCANAGFIKYFRDNRIGGSGGWAAVSVTPAGRIKRWFWNGSAWTD
jgi:prepilin-type N-terminal cleavage/methylation domain-containing protein